jgi:hypothetical protein
MQKTNSSLDLGNQRKAPQVNAEPCMIRPETKHEEQLALLFCIGSNERLSMASVATYIKPWVFTTPHVYQIRATIVSGSPPADTLALYLPTLGVR